MKVRGDDLTTVNPGRLLRGALGPIADIEEYFEIEEEERRKNEQAVWDWDKVMRRMEELENREESGGKLEEDQELEQKESVPKTAADWKAKGNDAFAKRKYHESIQLYSQAIELEPSSHVCTEEFASRGYAAYDSCNWLQILYGNRSAAYHRLKKYTDALNDANVAVQCDPSWVKVRQTL